MLIMPENLQDFKGQINQHEIKPCDCSWSRKIIEKDISNKIKNIWKNKEENKI